MPRAVDCSVITGAHSQLAAEGFTAPTDYAHFISFCYSIFINFDIFSFTQFSCTSRYVGEFCQHLNPCHTSSGPRCQNAGNCTATYNHGVPGFRCNCPIGFSASLCEIRERSACDSSPCQNGGSCTLKSLNDYICSCAQGYTGKFSGNFFLLEIED